MIRIVVTGPVCGGKTTFVRSLSEREALSTEEPASSIGKEETTVGLDVGFTTVRDRKIKLLGTPVQARFAYMWDLLATAADGFVLLLPADRQNAIAQSAGIATVITSDPQSPIGVGITRSDRAAVPVLSRAKNEFASFAAFIQQIDAREEPACQELLSSVIDVIAPGNGA